jgi:uncharacterized protein (TIGR02284 family)
MMESDERVETAADVLNTLLRVCLRTEEGFRVAAEATRRSDVKALLLELTTQRKDFAEELCTEVREIGGEPYSDQVTPALATRGIATIRAALERPNDKDVLKSCEDQEAATLEAYEAALAADLPLSSQRLVQRQFKVVEESASALRAAVAF